jgi:ribosomal protein L11 methyltransferase
MNNTIVYQISNFKETEKDILLALLSNLSNIEGIEEKETQIDFYIPAHEDKEEAIKAIQENIQFNYSKKILEHKNWNEIWESNFEPVIVNQKIGIRAVFHEKLNQVEKEIIIQPKMSFGTGHHATTAQMMQSMQLFDFSKKNILDLGSGTAVLAIYAEFLGAKNIIAIDNDTWCFENAAENIEINKCQNIVPMLGGIDDISNNKFDIILANIHKNYHLEHMKDYAKMLNAKGYILLSGFYEQDAKEILDLALEHNLIANYYTAQQNWVCLVLIKE